MRMRTLGNKKINPLKSITISNAFNTKISFPNIFHSPNRPKISKHMNKNLLTLKKDKIKHSEKHSPIIHRNGRIHNLNMVKILTFEDKINDIINTDLLLEKQKEKIDNNKTIKLLRLGLYKKKEKNENEETAKTICVNALNKKKFCEKFVEKLVKKYKKN